MKRVENVLSVFDGMSCGQIALRQAKIKYKNYYASEIDKFAIQQTQHNFPNTIQLGDVSKINGRELPKIDLFIGGSPCQGFSFAGAGLNFDDPRSKLFFEYVRIYNELKEKNPEVEFLLENVNMKREHLGVISKYMGIYPARINSTLVSAQNRDRFYWTNIRTKEEGLFNELWSDIPQPKDRGILLGDILQPEHEIDQKYYLKDKSIESLLKWGDRNKKNGNGFKPVIKGKNEKSSSLTTGSDKSTSTYIKLDINLKPKPNQEKASTFTAGGNSAGHHSDMDIIMTKNYVQWDVSGKGHKSQQDRAFYEDGKHGSLPSYRAEDKNGVLTRDWKLRRLTPTECSRLQTIPDWYEWIVSDSQIYKMLGNGWTTDVIGHILLS